MRSVQQMQDKLPTAITQFAVRADKEGGEARRILLWVFWTINLLLNAIYVILTFATATKLVKCYRDLDIQFSNTTWHAPIASAVLGGIMVLLFNILSCFILIRKTVNKSGPGFGYGFIMAWCFVMAFYTLLCGLVLDSFGDTVKNELQSQTSWSAYDTATYTGTIVLCFICMVFYFIFFVCLVVFQGGITKQLGLYDRAQDEKRRLEMSRLRPGTGNPLSATMDPQL